VAEYGTENVYLADLDDSEAEASALFVSSSDQIVRVVVEVEVTVRTV
jgi:hypothetical protein